MSFLFKELCEYYDKLERTTKRLEITSILHELFTHVSSDEVYAVCYLTLGRLGPPFDEPDLGIAEKLALEALSGAVGAPLRVVQQKYREIGDIGTLAEVLLRKGKTPSLDDFMSDAPLRKDYTVMMVWDELLRIASFTGKGSNEKKLEALMFLLRTLPPIAGRFLLRIVLGKMRIRAAHSTILEALALAKTSGSENKQWLEAAYNKTSDIGLIAKVLYEQGISGVKQVKMMIGRPIQVMAASRLQSPEEILEKLGGVVASEFKYDGLRVQVHVKHDNEGTVVRLFSRRQEDLTHHFPDLIKALPQAFTAESGIVEGEVVAFDYETQEIQSFQSLMTRRRKYQIEEAMKNVPVRVFLFDVLYVDGKEFLEVPYLKRREELLRVFKETRVVSFSTQRIIHDIQEFHEFFQLALDNNCEGIMAKDIRDTAIYQPGNRGFLWVKYKAEYVKELTDTFDLVIVGADYGRGKRSGFFGGFLMAVYDDEESVFKTICKLGTGFNDDHLAYFKEQLEPHILREKPDNVVTKVKPDVWVEPRIVLEVTAAEITESPMHSATNKAGKGLALRFPRFTGRIRDDKDPIQATSLREVQDLLEVSKHENSSS